MAYVHSAEFQNLPAEELAAAVARIAPAILNRCVFLLRGGSRANEAAVKARPATKHRGGALTVQASHYRPAAQLPRSNGDDVWPWAKSSVVAATTAPWYPAVHEIVAPECYRCPSGSGIGLRLACARQLEKRSSRSARERLPPHRRAHRRVRRLPA